MEIVSGKTPERPLDPPEGTGSDYPFKCEECKQGFEEGYLESPSPTSSRIKESDFTCCGQHLVDDELREYAVRQSDQLKTVRSLFQQASKSELDYMNKFYALLDEARNRNINSQITNVEEKNRLRAMAEFLAEFKEG